MRAVATLDKGCDWRTKESNMRQRRGKVIVSLDVAGR